jgi:hypothetical protein
MIKPIDYDRLAMREIRFARHYYGRIRAELAIRFMAAFTDSIRRIERTPQSFTPHTHGTRIAPIRKFRHWIVFIELPQHILIVALMHSSRRPGYWRRRLP